MIMKSFTAFLREAAKVKKEEKKTRADSKAVMQANRMGLKSDGHGGWYNERGEFVAKTEGDKLTFFNANQTDGERDPNQSETDKKLSGRMPPKPAPGTQAQETDPRSQGGGRAQPENAKQAAGMAKEVAQNDPNVGSAQQAVDQAVAKAENGQTKPNDVPKTKGTLTIAFGRFNPPTTGHEKLLNTVASKSDDNDYIIVPSRSNDKKKNPLEADRKAALMRQMYPDHAEKIVNDAGNKTIFDVLRNAHNDGYTNVRVVGGDDRVKEFEKLVNKYNGSTYQFDNIEVVSAGKRDADAEGVEGMSASKMRKAAKDNDFREFKKGLPKSVDTGAAVAIFQEIQAAMGIKPKDGVEPALVGEDWEIAPRLHTKDLRENYIKENAFNIGDWVSHDLTGWVGEIVRKGTNHLICVTENKTMFKAWTQDVSEPGGSAESTPTEREVGTDSLRAFLQRLTPGEKVRSFINKNKK